MANDVRLVVYDSGIAAMSLPGGAVWRWAYQRRKRVERTAKAFAPVRTGALRRSIKGTYNPAPPQHVIMEVHANIYYAVFVHEGTRRVISSPFGRTMKFKNQQGKNVYRKTVSGQHANPFLERALLAVMADL